MRDRYQQYVNMPRPHQHPELLIDQRFIREIAAHELPGHEKCDEKQQAVKQMETGEFHKLIDRLYIRVDY